MVLKEIKDDRKLQIFIGSIIIIIIFIIIYGLYDWIVNSPTKIYLVSKTRNGNYIQTTDSYTGKIMKKNSYQEFQNKDLPLPKYGNGYTYSLWLNVNDWEYNYGKPKHIFSKGDRECISVNPGVWLYPKDNNLMIRIDSFDRINKNSKSMNPSLNQNLNTQDKCDLIKLPLQRWNHIVIVLNNKILDVYLNGKLARSCEYDGPPLFNTQPLHITDKGGFGGLLGELVYYNSPLDASKIYKLYSLGNKTYNLLNKINNIKPKIHISAGINNHNITLGNPIPN
jgi:hypothetical protein